ncbi:MAG: secondary thiamine-phosphate synthase enzyme YjbQ [Actinobacteria bacterium]|nr:secondary thiamine-phosphate synthase enzyme YjbQ [Actinomycetota bacterium]MBU1942369.1 secondary thiamine-phosphate synthase enzyme YjbQ [Actinomycetota bacterium]MBU2689278.1 secondary thiamine-phosphate synthase enzyme YjbQ [Actinomycetota bacterium]
MTVITSSFPVGTRGDGDVVDITPDVAEAVRGSGLTDGTVTVFVPGATAGVTTIEYEPGLVEDIDEMFERVAPAGRDYHHNLRWHDGNGHSHVRASLLGPSLTIPFTGGKLTLGIWQQVVLVDFDNRPRERELVCQVMGE